MTQENGDQPPVFEIAQARRVRRDPILEELWAVKAQINKEAGYDVKRLLADAHATARSLGFTQYAVFPK
jgi:hypothetical protein